MWFAAAWMEPRDYHVKWSEPVNRERQIPYDITYMWHLKYDTNKVIYSRNRFTVIENRLVFAQGERGRRGMDWEFGLVDANYYIGWIDNKVLLYNTGNYIQYSVINHNGKEYRKRMYACILSHFDVQQKLTQHCKSTIY